MKKIIIVGAGLCGTLLAVRLAQRGFKVALYEKRGDMRRADVDAGRSINLALSDRGLMALDRVGLKEKMLAECIPMKGRMIHPLGGEAFLSPYSGRSENYINSVSRSGLNIALLNVAESYDEIALHFNTKVTKVDLEAATISYQDNTGQQKQDSASLVIGTDGAGSVVRRSMMGQTTKLLFNYSQNFLRHGYKELSILPSPTGAWQIEKNALHIWPRGHFMIIALPNLDGSFTLTMFHPFGTDIGFDALDSPAKVRAFFKQYFPSLLPYVPHYVEEYFENPVGTLGTIKCLPWQAYGKALIMGDAAHAIVPFYGQGMNASFEDVRVFDDLLEIHGDNWSTLLPAFENARAENANAIADLALDNFTEMIDKVDDVPFIRKRQIERELELEYPDYYSKYSLVTFRPEMPYAQAMAQGRRQDEMLLELCAQDNFDQIPLAEYHRRLQNLVAV
ncbi:MAG: NAD(P)/FAD-dependent oxidoreductase [Bacteroidota bacterium]